MTVELVLFTVDPLGLLENLQRDRPLSGAVRICRAAPPDHRRASLLAGWAPRASKPGWTSPGHRMA